MKKNIAVIGCGHWGKNLVRNFAELGALAAVCDPNDQLAQSYAEQYSVGNLSFAAILASPTIEGSCTCGSCPPPCVHGNRGDECWEACIC